MWLCSDCIYRRDQTADLTRAVHDLKTKVVVSSIYISAKALHGSNINICVLQYTIQELQSSLARCEKDKQELEQQLKNRDKDNKRLVDKIAECLEEKQNLEEELHRKDDILKIKVWVFVVICGFKFKF